MEESIPGREKRRCKRRPCDGYKPEVLERLKRTGALGFILPAVGGPGGLYAGEYHNLYVYTGLLSCYRRQLGSEEMRAAGRGHVRRGREVEVPAEGDDCREEAGERGRGWR